MSDTPDFPDYPDYPDYIGIIRAKGKMLKGTASTISVRKGMFEVVGDEPPIRGGEDRGPTPLEYIAIGLCA